MIWKTFGVLLFGALVGAVAILPYALALAPPKLPPGAPPLPLLLVLSVVQTLVLASVAITIGLWLGPKVGLGAPQLEAWLAGDRAAPRQFVASLPLAAGLGVLSGVLVLLLDLTVFLTLIPALASSASPRAPAIWQGLLASLYGAIDEETLTRLGLMTLLVWIGAKIIRTDRPGPAVMWTANVLTAVLFGLGHLPATAAVLPLSSLVVVRAIVLNGLAGVAFGWLYWRRGLLAAMGAHFCADLVLHVLTPLVQPPR